jgi:hypothetical protein
MLPFSPVKKEQTRKDEILEANRSFDELDSFD